MIRTFKDLILKLRGWERMRKTLFSAVLVGLSLVVLSRAMVINQPEMPQVAPVEVEVSSGDKVVACADVSTPEVCRVSVQSSISVVWRHPSSGAMMSRCLTEAQAEQARQLMLAGHTMDQSMLAIPGKVAIMDAPADHKGGRTVSAL